MLEQLEKQFTKYEIARILGARSLQIAMDAPLLLKIPTEDLEAINYNPIEIAKKELLAGVLPITVNRPLPKRRDEKIKKLSKEELEEMKKKLKEKEELEDVKAKEDKGKKTDEKVEEQEETEEKDIVEGGEIMELAAPEDEAEESDSSREEEGI
jgi:DNA-directed RNA polymerase subunit K